jgi:hypothetical protein
MHEFLPVLIKIASEVATPEVDQSAIGGEAGTGYEDGSKGAFQCSNCTYSDENSTCGHPLMQERSKLPREGDRVKIDPNGCCEYVNRKGE